MEPLLPTVLSAAFFAAELITLAAPAKVQIQVPHAGLSCRSAAGSSSRALGDPIIQRASEPDIPGSDGNEINQIYRVDSLDPPQVLGWIFRSFNHRWQFEPYADGLRNVFVPISIQDIDDVSAHKIEVWTQHASASVGTKFKRPTIFMRKINMSQCFKKSWNGSD